MNAIEVDVLEYPTSVTKALPLWGALSTKEKKAKAVALTVVAPTLLMLT